MKALAYALGIFRSIIGIVLLLFPTLALPIWLPGFKSNDIASILAQHMGIRDIVLGFGLIYSLRTQKNYWWMWLLGATLCDFTDTLISILRPDVFAPNGNISSYFAGAVLLFLEGWVLYLVKRYPAK